MRHRLTLFVAGTGSDVGKTYTTGHLACDLAALGYAVTTQKWVQTGSLQPDDILAHDAIRESADPQNMPLRCPYRFLLPASPHLAAAEEKTAVDLDVLWEATRTLQSQSEIVLIEGSGGVAVPLTADHTFLDFLSVHPLPVLLVAANQLGVLNHTLLTVEALRRRQLPIVGIVLNAIHPIDPRLADDNARTLAHLTKLPILSADRIVSQLRIGDWL